MDFLKAIEHSNPHFPVDNLHYTNMFCGFFTRGLTKQVGGKKVEEKSSKIFREPVLILKVLSSEIDPAEIRLIR